ncbi:kinase domain-containing protein [Tricladium varicosporioides]|nr:kinase domain-containing protein [Hymenoscyphus varicosporioides]
MARRTGLHLYGQLSKSWVSDELHGNRQYIPLDVMNKIITKKSIQAELERKGRNCMSLSGCLADKVVKKNAKKLFAILVCLSKACDIKEFLNDGFTDEDLPIIEDEDEFRSAIDTKKKFLIPEDWEDQTIDLFLVKQWMVLAPVFNTSGTHIILHEDCPLPFSKLEEILHSKHNVVYRAEVNPSHQEGFEADAPKLQVALKEFKYREDFVQERDNLQKIRRLEKHKHITQNLATFEQGDKCYIVFPFAEGGDLDNFWESENSKSRTPELALWSLQQMLGLAEALQALHKEIGEESNCRHGDLKPGNILHFLTDEQREGILKISDFGVSRIHNSETIQRIGKPTECRATTPSYEAPEASPILKVGNGRSRRYDVWSLGCIYLEFVIWLVQDWDAIQTFTTARVSDWKREALFYQITDGTAHVHPVVIQRILVLKGVLRSQPGTALGDLLDLIETNLLKVDVQLRLESPELYTRLRRIVQKAESDPVYLFSNEVSAVAR